MPGKVGQGLLNRVAVEANKAQCQASASLWCSLACVADIVRLLGKTHFGLENGLDAFRGKELERRVDNSLGSIHEIRWVSHVWR